MPKKADIHERLNGKYTCKILMDYVLWRSQVTLIL
ncbi:unnamed protein product [Brassica oleracea var. botrytis]